MDYYRTLPSTAGLLASTPRRRAAGPPARTAEDGVRGFRRRSGAAHLPPPNLPPGVTVLPAMPMLSPPDWLASVFYPQRRVDGMFMTDASGKLIASVPQVAAANPGTGQEAHAAFSAAAWKTLPDQPDTIYRVSPVYARAVGRSPGFQRGRHRAREDRRGRRLPRRRTCSSSGWAAGSTLWT